MLQFWSNGVDTVIAENMKDAIAIWEQTTGESWSDYKDEDEWELVEQNPGDVIRVAWVDDEPIISDIPKGGYIEQAQPNGYAYVVATVEQWINHSGPCYFSTTEY